MDDIFDDDSSPKPDVGNFFIQPIPDAWKEILTENFPVLMGVLQYAPAYLGGGLLRTIISSEPLDPQKTDIDLFFRDGGTYIVVKGWFEVSPNFDKVFQCPEDRLSTFVEKETGWKYQLIAVDFYANLLDVVSSFDFTTICIGTDGNTLIYHKDTFSDTMDKVLRWNKITYPAASMRRMMKYARKGFTMSESEYQYFVQVLWNNSPDVVDAKLVYVD